MSINDLIKFLEPYIIEYTDQQKLSECVKFFDMDNDGEIGAPELENMLVSFGKTEGSYMTDKEIAEIVLFLCSKKNYINNVEVLF